MHLLRCLFFFVAIKLWSVHVPGVCNGAADALSRDNHPGTGPVGQASSRRHSARDVGGPGNQTPRLDVAISQKD